MLGAANIGNWAMVQPARATMGVALYAIAARDHERAKKYAEKYQIPKVHTSYDALINDPDIDAIYNPLPNSLHCEWTINALAAGKHVLCEKPLCSNAEQAQQMQNAANRYQRVLMEAFHYRYHPMAKKMQDAMAQLGEIKSIETNMCVPLPSAKDIRYRYDLAGGATMDVGAYTANLLRFLGQSSLDEALHREPKVISAVPILRGPNIDRAMKAVVQWDNGVKGYIHNSLLSATLIKLSAHVVGENGVMHVINPYLPHFWNRFALTLNGQKHQELVVGKPTYFYQLAEFARRIRAGAPYISDLSDSISNMAMIDAIYVAAGLPKRGM